MNIFEFPDDSDEELGFLSGLSTSQKSDQDRKQQADNLQEETLSLIQTLKKESPMKEKKKINSQLSLSQESIKSNASTIIDFTQASSTLSHNGKKSSSIMEISSQDDDEEEEPFNDTKKRSPVKKSPKKKVENLSPSELPTPTSTATNSRVPTPTNSKSMASSLPLHMPNALPRATTLLVQLEDTKLDLSGDVGAIGRFHTHGKDEIMLDIKGNQYIGEIIPCAAFMVVGIGATEAKVENIMTDFCQISQKRDIMESISGVVTAGTLDNDPFNEHVEDKKSSKPKSRKKSKSQEIEPPTKKVKQNTSTKTTPAKTSKAITKATATPTPKKSLKRKEK